MRNGEPRFVDQHRWSNDETERLADMIADGLSFARAGKALSRTKNSCISRWHHAIVAPMGAQAA